MIKDNIILSYIIDYNFLSPQENKNEHNASDVGIEFLLFGKSISLFNFKQLLYLLDYNNYNKSLKTFQEEFNGINYYKAIFPSQEFIKLFEEINIDIDVSLINDIKKNSSIDEENEYIISGDGLIETPELNNCVQNFELF